MATISFTTLNRETPEVCPVCGEDVPPKAKACPNCGACHESGWGENADVESVDITEYGYEEAKKFDYEKWVRREEGRERAPGLHPMWKIAALLLLCALFFGLWKWLYKIGSASWF